MLDLVISQIFINLLFSWSIAQLIKFFIRRARKDQNASNFFGSGGFPSAHTAFVMTLFFSFVYEFGWNSNFVIVAFVFASIVIYDSLVLRYEVEKHAKALLSLNEQNNFLKYNLREKVGHTKIEVIGGVILALIVTIISYELF